MSITQIFQTILWVLMAAFGGLSLWYKQNAVIQSKAAELIAEAESRYKKLTKSGGIKFEWVAVRVYQMIPAAIRPLVPRNRIDALIQTTFDAMQDYAVQQMDRMAEKLKKEEDLHAE